MQSHQQSPTEAGQLPAAFEPGDSSEAVFGRRLRQERERRGLTQGGLANMLGQDGLRLDPTAITRIEKGERGVRLNEALKIARALGCTLDYLLDPFPTRNAVEALERIEAELSETMAEIATLETRIQEARRREATLVDDLEAARDYLSGADDFDETGGNPRG